MGHHLPLQQKGSISPPKPTWWFKKRAPSEKFMAYILIIIHQKKLGKRTSSSPNKSTTPPNLTFTQFKIRNIWTKPSWLQVRIRLSAGYSMSSNVFQTNHSFFRKKWPHMVPRGSTLRGSPVGSWLAPFWPVCTPQGVELWLRELGRPGGPKISGDGVRKCQEEVYIYHWPPRPTFFWVISAIFWGLKTSIFPWALGVQGYTISMENHMIYSLYV